MKTIVVCVLIALIGIFEINAQIIQSVPNELSGSKDILQETKLKSNLLLQQVGDAGNALLGTEQGMAFSNKAIINQTGNNHITNLSQNGNGNEANLFSTGSFTKLEVTQTGNNNSILSKLSNNTLQLYSAMLEQKGNSNNIELTLLGNDVIPDIERVVSVKQTGNDLSFSGNYDSPDMPVIEQKSGLNGEGMDVTVTTSSFYFPSN